jgi:hypothetical protein
MRLNAPKKWVWFISLILAVVSIINFFAPFIPIAGITYWIMVVAWLLLFLATWLKGF